MSRIVVSEFITVDGVAEGPGAEPDFERAGWAFTFDRGTEGAAYKMQEIMAAGALFLGRTTYEGFSQAWPTMKNDDDYAARMNGLPKHVMSSTSTDLSWNASAETGNLSEVVTRLKKQTAGDLLVYGSIQLAQALTSLALVDEYRLMVFPVVLGAGRRLFTDVDLPSRLRLVETRPVGDNGVAVMTYRPEPAE